MLGSYLADVCGGDIRRRGEIDNLEEDERLGGHARRVMAAYEKWLGEGPELAVLRLLGLFDRPAPADSITVLRAAPVIPGLTDALQNLSETKWRQSLSKLRRIRLLAEPDAREATGSPVAGQTEVRGADELDAHPLVREHFRQQLQCHHTAAWREANLRLYEHLCATTKEFPDTVEEMAPLFAAVAHGCAAGRHQQALDDVYFRRIQRGKEAFNTKKLCAIGAELSTLAGFFASPWQQLALGLTEPAKAYILSEASFDLRALGRLKEAVHLMQVAIEAAVSQQDWKHAAIGSGNLSELYLTIGDLPQALLHAKQSVELADRSGDRFQRMLNRTTLADALHQAGCLNEAEEAFREAEAMQKEWQPASPLLYSWQGFRYCDLLLGQGKYQEVQNRAAHAIEIAKQGLGLLNTALDNLLLGRACLQQARQEGGSAADQAAAFLKSGVDGLRQAGAMEFIARGLLAREEMYRLTGDYLRAQSDLAEVQRIAERGEMGLHLCDCHLEWARLCLAQGDPTVARENWVTAKVMVKRMGYHRRDREVEEIARELSETA